MSLKLIFMGSPDFAVPSLRALHQAGHEISLVVSNPDKRRSRNGAPDPTPVKQYALDHKIPYSDAEDLKDRDFIDKIRSINPDLLVVVAFRILPAVVLELARLGAINVHASLLPKYRGAAPIHHAILQGETETGCTIFKLSEKMDAGQIIARLRVPIGPNDTTGDLYNRLSGEGASLLIQAVDQLEKGEVRYEVQDETLACPAPKVFTEDGHLDFRKEAQQVHNQARAMTPVPGAWLTYIANENPEKLKIYCTRISDIPLSFALTAGELAYDSERKNLLLGCGAGSTLILEEVQLPGRTRISGAEFACSYPIGKGLVR